MGKLKQVKASNLHMTVEPEPRDTLIPEPLVYWFSYYYTKHGCPGWGNCSMDVNRPPRDSEDMKVLTQRIEALGNYESVVILNWRAFHE
jgi:hypothetical protein